MTSENGSTWCSEPAEDGQRGGRALAERGHRVRAVNRAGDADVPEGIERVAAT